MDIRKVVDWALLAMILYWFYVMFRWERDHKDSERQYRATMDTFRKLGEGHVP